MVEDSQTHPHKPLLILYALGRLSRGEGRLIPYQKVDSDLRRLPIEFDYSIRFATC